MHWQVKATGHPNIRAEHRTTWQFTKEERLSPRGDCIIAINATAAACDLPQEVKIWLQQGNWVKLKLDIDGQLHEGKGQGHPDLTFTDQVDMVFRRSEYTCGRTITINTTFTAQTLPRNLVDLLREGSTDVQLTITTIEN